MSKAVDTEFRVIRLPESLRKALKTARDAAGQTNQEFIAHVVESNLPTLVKKLDQLGFGQAPGRFRATRLPFSDHAGTWTSLRDASNQLQIPATRLLQLCLASAVDAKPAAKIRGRRRKSSKLTANSAISRARKASGRSRGKKKRRT